MAGWWGNYCMTCARCASTADIGSTIYSKGEIIQSITTQPETKEIAGIRCIVNRLARLAIRSTTLPLGLP